MNRKVLQPRVWVILWVVLAVVAQPGAGEPRNGKPDGPGGSVLSVESNPLGAMVTVKTPDNKSVASGRTPFTKHLKPGVYSVYLEKDGYDSLTIPVTVVKGKKIGVDAAKATLRKHTGILKIDPVPYEEGAEIRVDGVVEGHVPETVSIGEGTHEVRVRGIKLKGQDTVTIRDRETRTLRIEMKRGGDMETNSVGMTFVFVGPGSFMMGSPDTEAGRVKNETLHKANLTRGFYIQTTLVTQGQWKTVMGGNPSHFKSVGDHAPVDSVSWEDAQAFIRQLNSLEGMDRYRLPTEAEWEYACRAGSGTPFANGNTADAMGWIRENAGGRTHPTAYRKPNAWGIYDMHGNVWEWCADWYADYPVSEVTDPKGPETGHERVIRGGSWMMPASNCRCAVRHRYAPIYRYDIVGFRVAMNPES